MRNKVLMKIFDPTETLFARRGLITLWRLSPSGKEALNSLMVKQTLILNCCSVRTTNERISERTRERLLTRIRSVVQLNEIVCRIVCRLNPSNNQTFFWKLNQISRQIENVNLHKCCLSDISHFINNFSSTHHAESFSPRPPRSVSIW